MTDDGGVMRPLGGFPLCIQGLYLLVTVKLAGRRGTHRLA